MPRKPVPRPPDPRVPCGACAYLNPTPDGRGVCHRYAPSPGWVHRTEREALIVLWPLVRQDEWCGEGVARG